MMRPLAEQTIVITGATDGLGRALAGELAAAGAALALHGRVDVLVNNAGIGATVPGDGRRMVSRDGYELRFAVNYLSHYLLTRSLLPLLVSSAPARIVNADQDRGGRRRAAGQHHPGGRRSHHAAGERARTGRGERALLQRHGPGAAAAPSWRHHGATSAPRPVRPAHGAYSQPRTLNPGGPGGSRARPRTRGPRGPKQRRASAPR